MLAVAHRSSGNVQYIEWPTILISGGVWCVCGDGAWGGGGETRLPMQSSSQCALQRNSNVDRQTVDLWGRGVAGSNQWSLSNAPCYCSLTHSLTLYRSLLSVEICQVVQACGHVAFATWCTGVVYLYRCCSCSRDEWVTGHRGQSSQWQQQQSDSDSTRYRVSVCQQTTLFRETGPANGLSNTEMTVQAVQLHKVLWFQLSLKYFHIQISNAKFVDMQISINNPVQKC